ncbi:MAG: MFS transporter [Patescibacteria group bacterium]
MFKNINPVVKIFVIADFFYNAAFASFAPVFAIFITGQIVGGSASVAGFATATYWVVKSIFQLPVARFLDRTDGERDDFWAMWAGYFLTGFIPIAYIFVKEPWHLYLIQGIHGFIMAWLVPAWYSIFTRHVDKWRISFEWSLESVFSVGMATAAAAALGGYLVDTFGFELLFLASGITAIASSFMILMARRHLVGKNRQERVFPEKPHGRK